MASQTSLSASVMPLASEFVLVGGVGRLMCWDCVSVCKRARSALDLSSVYSSVEYIINKLIHT